MGLRLWIDDERRAPVGYTHTAKTAAEAIALLAGASKYGGVEHVSFDHDLAFEHYAGDFSKTATGYEVAAWVEQEAHAGRLPAFTWEVHSMNPAGRMRIVAALQSAERAWARRA